MTKTFRHYDADYTPNDMGPPEIYTDKSRTPKEVGDSELATIAERDDEYNLDTI